MSHDVRSYGHRRVRQLKDKGGGIAFFSKKKGAGVSMASLVSLCMKLFAAVVLALTPFYATAAYPDKPVSLVVPYPAGGSIDTIARLFAAKASAAFRGKIIVMNKPGAGGMIGENEVARSKPDGYTLLFDAAGAAINPSLYSKPLYDPKNLAPVAQLLSLPFVLVKNPGFLPDSLIQVIDAAKQNPNSINVATAGSSTLLVSEIFRQLANVEFSSIPYNGGPPAALSLMRNETQLYFTDVPSVVQYIKSGKMSPIAVTSEKRIGLLPDVPTAIELGMPKFTVASFFGVFAPAGTPAPIVQQLNVELNRFMRLPEVIALVDSMGAQSVNGSSEEFGKFFARQLVVWKEAIAKSGMPLK